MIYMEEVFNNILVFKTNIKTAADRQAVKKLLDGHSCIRKWNVDLQDVHISEPSLENLFLHHTGRSLRE